MLSATVDNIFSDKSGAAIGSDSSGADSDLGGGGGASSAGADCLSVSVGFMRDSEAKAKVVRLAMTKSERREEKVRAIFAGVFG